MSFDIFAVYVAPTKESILFIEMLSFIYGMLNNIKLLKISLI